MYEGNIQHLKTSEVLTGSVSSGIATRYVMGLQSCVLLTRTHGRNMGPRSSPSETSRVRVVVAVRRVPGYGARSWKKKLACYHRYRPLDTTFTYLHTERQQ